MNPLLKNLKKEFSGWKSKLVISAAGIYASGWTEDDKIFLLSSNGYSITNPENLKREVRDYDEENQIHKNISKDNLSIKIKEYEKPIKVFGLLGGDGNHYTMDRWSLERFSISIFEEVIGIGNLQNRFVEKEYWKNFEIIKLQRLEYTKLKMGFSNNQNYFGIFGSAGAEIFERLDISF